MKPEEIRDLYKEQTKAEPIIFPVCHGEKGYASWEYLLWLEKKVAEQETAGHKPLTHVTNKYLVSEE